MPSSGAARALVGFSPDHVVDFGWAWRIAVFAVTLLFFSNVSVHGVLYASWPVRPVELFALTAIILGVFVYARLGLTFLATPLTYWATIFVLTAVTWFIIFGGDSLSFLLARCYAATFLVAMFALYSVHPHAVVVARKAVAVAVVLAAVCNVYEVLNPTAFLPPGEFYGRSAGFYMNPNASGTAIVLGTVLSIGVVPRRWRWVFLSVSSGALALTLSRAAILVWVIAVGGLILTRQLSFRTAATAVVGVAISAYVAWQLLAERLLADSGINLELLVERVGLFTVVNSVPDYSQMERMTVAQKALLLFEENLLYGGGLGSTEVWSEAASTHNMYLYFMADYGLVGALVYPLLVLATLLGGGKKVDGYGAVFAVSVLAFGFFSHNIVGELYFLLSFALVAAGMRASRAQLSMA